VDKIGGSFALVFTKKKGTKNIRAGEEEEKAI